MNLLFITRKYPPMIGGMEQVSFSLAQEFRKTVATTLITWGKSQKYLPYFILFMMLRALFVIPKKKINHLHIGDALLSPFGLLLRYIFGIKATITVHGLDIIFDFPGYQLLVPWCVGQFDKVICISNATRTECIKRGIAPHKCVVIPWGVYGEKFVTDASRKDLEEIVGEKLSGKKILLTVGRLVKRKGVLWFITHIIPTLDKNVVYVIIGEGAQRDQIEQTIKQLHLQQQVFLLGKVTQENLRIAYNTADLFIMPNIKDTKSIEGFGVVALEASSTGLWVLASNIEGISDAIVENRNGLLVESSNLTAWLTQLTKTLSHKKNVREDVKQWTKSHFSWEKVAKNYLKEFQN